jgi:hypothetical protein
MNELQLIVRTEGQSSTVELNDDDISGKSVGQVVADVVAPVVGRTKPIVAESLRKLASHHKTSFLLKQEDASGQVSEAFVSKHTPLRDLIKERTKELALEMERAADGGAARASRAAGKRPPGGWSSVSDPRAKPVRKAQDSA